MTISFQHGALTDTYEEQANVQGFTLGDWSTFAEMVRDGLVGAYVHGCITDNEYEKILHRFQTKVLIKNLKPLKKEDK